MKIVESQAAVLSNFEVYQHLTEQRDRYKKNKRRGPPNLETVVREVSHHLALSYASSIDTSTSEYTLRHE